MAIHWIKKKLTTVGDKVKALKIRKPVFYHNPRRVPNPRQRRPPSPYPGAEPRSPRATREDPAPGIIRRRRSVALMSQMHALMLLAASDPELDGWLEDALPTHVDDTSDDRTIVGDSEGDEPPFVSRERYVARTTFRVSPFTSGSVYAVFTVISGVISVGRPSAGRRSVAERPAPASVDPRGGRGFDGVSGEDGGKQRQLCLDGRMSSLCLKQNGRCSYPAVYIQDDEPAITWFCPENFEILYDLLLSPDWHSR